MDNDYQQEAQNDAPEEEEFVPIVLGDSLQNLVGEMNQKFGRISKNMEKQLVNLRRELDRERAENARLKSELKDSNQQMQAFRDECTKRTKDLSQINTFYEEEKEETSFADLLNEVIQRHEGLSEAMAAANFAAVSNVNGESKDWQNEIYRIAKNVRAGASSAEQQALIDEMQQRTKELQKIRAVLDGNEPISLYEDLVDGAEERHAAQNGDPVSTYQTNEINDPQAIADNNEWEDTLRAFQTNPPKGSGTDELNARNELYQQELNNRVEDLREVKDIFDKKQDENYPQEDLVDQARNLLTGVQGRHNDTEGKVKSTVLDPNSKEENRRVEQFVTDDIDWRRELGEMVNAIVDEQKEPEEVWWLDGNEDRRRVYDRIIVDQTEHDILMKDAVYLNRELPDENNPHTANYIPIEPVDNHRVFGTLFDAGEVCDLLAQVNPNVMDTRCIHRPTSIEEPYPLTDKQVRENVNLLLSSCKALALRLPSYEASVWIDPRSHAALLVAVLHALAKEKLKNFVSFEKHPEIVRLLSQQELNDDPGKVKNELLPEEILKRWMNVSLGRPMKEDIRNMPADVYNTLRNTDPNFRNAPELRNGVLNKVAAELLVNHLKNTMGVDTNLQAEDLMDGNFKLEELMAAQAFDLVNGLAPLSDAEKQKYRALWTDDNHDDDAYVPFLNSQLPPHLRITNLYRDLSDGIVLARILERSKPGCINWKKLNKNIRHKFDKVNNCNYAYKVMTKEFPFRLVGIGGTDIVDGHQKYIHTILWQIMRYQATKKLSELSFNGKPVSDADIINWAKATHAKLEDRRAITMKGFRDRTLTTCVFYIELLKVFSGEGFVKDELVHYSVPMLSGHQEDGNMKERMDNARYAIGLIRRHGGDIFILPEDLVIMEPKAVLSVFAALMTIDYQITNEETKSNNNNNADMEDLNQAEQALYDGGFSG